jgi:hypothetical protein
VRSPRGHAVVRVWKAYERSRLLERAQSDRAPTTSEIQRGLEGLGVKVKPIMYTLPYSQIPKRLDAALSFAERCQTYICSVLNLSSLARGANAFAVQYVHSQSQFRILYRWRMQLTARTLESVFAGPRFSRTFFPS